MNNHSHSASKSRYLLWAGWYRQGIGAALAAILMAAAAPVMPATDAIQVVYENPEKFTDFGEHSYIITDTRRNEMLAQLTRHLERRVVNHIPTGSTLTISISDIDMAGGFEGWHRGGGDRVRMVRDVYPPRIDLAFRLTDAAGKVVAEGRRVLTNLSFMTHIDYRGGLLRHEKKLLDDWLAREFPDAAAY